MKALLKKLFTKPCPNCLSAWTGGVADPEGRKFCFVCSNPRTNKIRGWIWRFVPLRYLVKRKNLKRYLKRLHEQHEKTMAEFDAEKTTIRKGKGGYY